MRFYRVPDWRALPVLRAASWCTAMLSQPESWAHRKINPDWQWTLDNQLHAAAVDELRVVVWQQTKDGQKGRKQPKPISRPGVKGYGEKSETVSLPIEEVERLLSLPRVAGG